MMQRFAKEYTQCFRSVIIWTIDRL